MARELNEKEKSRFETKRDEILCILDDLEDTVEYQEFTENDREELFSTLDNIIEELDNLESTLEV